MAELSTKPKDWELEDLIAAYFISRGCYVETGVTERSPEEILELDIVWTDYRPTPYTRHAVEVKSGEVGFHDIFKFYGWTQYLKLDPGEFIHSEAIAKDAEALSHVAAGTGLKILHIPTLEAVETHFKALGFAEPSWPRLTELWRYSFWAQRRLLKSLNEAVRRGVCVESAKAAKKYHHLINNAVFFIPEPHNRIDALMKAHLEHKELGATAAYEIETGKLQLKDTPDTDTFKAAYYYGKHFPVQACLYLAYRARLYILKALVDFWLTKSKEDPRIIRVLMHVGLTQAMIDAMEKLRGLTSFKQLPVFWQVFLWSWGGFLLTDRLEAEYAQLAKETGVPIGEIPLALQAFDLLFPTGGGWFRQPNNDSRKVLMLMPAAMRGIGAYRRLTMNNVEEYPELGYSNATAGRMSADNNVGVRLLETEVEKLVT